MPNVGLRLIVETAAAVASFVAFLPTLFVRDWIEILFRVDPDHRSGLAEWLILGVLLTVALVASALARSEWRRLRIASASGS